MNLASWILWAMLTWTPLDIVNRPALGSELQRFSEIADDLAREFAGMPHKALIATALASVESGGWRADVDELGTAGDGGRSVCLAQIWLRPGEHIASRRECFALEHARIDESFRSCPGLPEREQLAVYASGHCDRGHAASRTRMDRALKWERLHPFREELQPL